MASSKFGSLGAEPFATFWAREMQAVIAAEYQELLAALPTRMKTRLEKKDSKKDKDKKDKKDKKEDAVSAESDELTSVQHKLAGVLKDVKDNKQRRNVYCNLAWTGPLDNTRLHTDISYGTVANMTYDMFCDTSTVAASAEVDVVMSQALEGDEAEKFVTPKPTLAQAMESRVGRPWNIPGQVERGFEIPICITDTGAVPELGRFKRLNMDVVVNAAWLGLFWAKTEKNDEVVSAIKNLILDWPMDFILIEGSTPDDIEENMFTWSVNMSAKVERLRDFLGLENSNMMRIVASAAEIVGAKHVTKKANSAAVQKWLVDNIRWGTHHCPDIATVERHLLNGAAIKRNPGASEIIEAALHRWGRNNLLDWPTKLALIVGKTDQSSLCYVIEFLYIKMLRKNTADPFGTAELKRVIPEILWVRTYIKNFLRQFPEVLNSVSEQEGKQGALTATMAVVKRFLESPLAFYTMTESAERDPTWLHSLPNEALRSFMKHAVELSQGMFQPEINGALAMLPGDKYNIDRFLKGSRVSVRFTAGFSIAYDSLVGKPAAASASGAEGEGVDSRDSAKQNLPASAGASNQEKQTAKNKDDANAALPAFRDECEKHCKRELDARLVSLIAEGSHVEIHASVASTRLYENMTASVPGVMAYYDVRTQSCATSTRAKALSFPKCCDRHVLNLVCPAAMFRTPCSKFRFPGFVVRTPCSNRCHC